VEVPLKGLKVKKDFAAIIEEKKWQKKLVKGVEARRRIATRHPRSQSSKSAQ